MVHTAGMRKASLAIPPYAPNRNFMKKLLRTCISITALALTLATSLASAADTTVGVINVRRILSESRAAKEAMTKFQVDFGARGQEVIAQTSALKKKAEDLDKALPTLSATQRLERERDLTALNRELDRKKQQLADEREARQRDDIQNIIQIARGVVTQISADGKLHAVFQEVVYVNPKNDITDKVLQVMDTLK